MIELTPPGRGQMVSHDLYPAEERKALLERHGRGAGESPVPHAPPLPVSATPRAAPSEPPRIAEASGEAELRAEIARLREEIAGLAARLERLESQG